MLSVLGNISRANLWEWLTPERMSVWEKSLPLERLSKATKDDVRKVLTAVDSEGERMGKSPLFPHGVIVVENHPLQLMEANCDLIWGAASGIFMTYAKDDGAVESISVATALPCDLGIAFEINYHGINDVNTILAHIVKQADIVSQVKDSANICGDLMICRDDVSGAGIAKIQDWCYQNGLLRVPNGTSSVAAELIFRMPKPGQKRSKV